MPQASGADRREALLDAVQSADYPIKLVGDGGSGFATTFEQPDKQVLAADGVGQRQTAVKFET